MQAYRPDRVTRLLTGLVSIACFGLLVLGVIVVIGLPVVKLVAGEDSDWTIGLPVPVVLVDSDATVLTQWGNARLEAEALRGTVRLPVSILPWWLFAVLWTYVTAAIGLTLLFLNHLRRIFQRVRSGAPFDVANVLRLRWLGLIALGLAMLNGVSELVTTLAVRDGVSSERLAVAPGVAVNGWLVFFGLVLLALAEIFRRGAVLEEEQSLIV